MTTKPIHLELDETEAQSLLQLLDLASKAGGLQVARQALFFHDALQQAHTKAQATLKVVEKIEKGAKQKAQGGNDKAEVG